MRPFFILLSLLAVAVSGVVSTALTYKLAANEKACFFTFVERAGAKVAFYFAVRWTCNPREVCRSSDVSRFNREGPSMSTTPWSAPMINRSWMARKNGRETLSSRRRPPESTDFVLTMRCQHSPTRWWILRLRYITAA